uniref:EF-hand domain-containing protein n=1 Tax=Globisporangium ultimum (strain ATCC 200006 / CBS 805.95 / DAOM BR144) TaxID=431595 RepID=K3WGW0_GLOUD
MGNKHGKPRGSSGAKAREDLPDAPPRPQVAPPGAPASSKPSTAPAPAAAASVGGKPPRPSTHSSHLEFKLSQLDVSTIFAPHEIQAIRKHLAGLLRQSETDAIMIPKDEFFRFLGTTPTSLYTNRLYTIFDLSGKGYVTFDDLINGLSVLNQKATREQKLTLSFHLLDPDGTGYISKKVTTDVLRSCLAECRELEITLSEEQIARIVNTTFDEADLDRNGLIDMNEYQLLDAKHPGLSDFLTVDAFGVLNHLEKVHSMNTGIALAE